MPDNGMLGIIEGALRELEQRGDIVLCADMPTIPAAHTLKKIDPLIPGELMSEAEAVGLRALILHAIMEKRFFDWEMPVLTGLTAKDFERIENMLPREWPWHLAILQFPVGVKSNAGPLELKSLLFNIIAYWRCKAT